MTNSTNASRSLRILALENDVLGATRLTNLLRQHLDVEVVVAQSGDEAIAAISSVAPDVVLVSSLLSPKDESQLVAHLNEHRCGGDLQLLTVPPVVETPRADTRSWVSFLSGQPKTPHSWYDTEAIVTRVRDALDHAQSRH